MGRQKAVRSRALRRQVTRPRLDWAGRAVLAALAWLLPAGRRRPSSGDGTQAYALAVIEHAKLLDRTLIWNQAHLRRILREYETHDRVRRQNRVVGLINEYRLVA